MAYKYIPFFGGQTKLLINNNTEEFKVKPGELTRWYDSSSNVSENHPSNTQSKVYEISMPPEYGNAIEVIFPEEGTYFGNDHDLGRVLGGAGFVVIATKNSTSEGHTNGS